MRHGGEGDAGIGSSSLIIAVSSPWVETFGRLHVSLVHFPIALIAVAGVLEVWRIVRRRSETSEAARKCLVLGAAAAVVAVASGWVHKQGLESSDTLVVHQWVGVATAALAIVLAILYHRRPVVSRKTVAGVLACALMVLVTGHFGGAMIHGDGYFTELLFKGGEVADSKEESAAVVAASDPHESEFKRDVWPILAENCYECHSSAKRRGGLSLDGKSAAFKGGNSGPSIVAGKPDESALLLRVMGHGEKKRMPLNKPALSEAQVTVLREWIAKGAIWPDAANGLEAPPERQHWAFVKPVRPNLPTVKDNFWPRNPIDYFVLARLEKEGLKPSPQADKATLCRRLYLDLVGLPPSPEEVEAFARDTQGGAYERLVDKLLDSPHYGERWGRHWLDLARYADTNGYEKDNARIIWPYRDWVINAFNKDMPFTQFVIEQMAGDMLPKPTPEQTIATGFHRNTMINEEGGIDVEEFRYKAVVDRVQTTSTALLGVTMHCAQCHDHKYDPFTQKEYFQFFGLMNNADEPTFNIRTADLVSKRTEIEKKVKELEGQYPEKFPTTKPVVDWKVPTIAATTQPTKGGATLTPQPDGAVLASGPVPKFDEYELRLSPVSEELTQLKLEVLTDPSLPKGGPGRQGAEIKNGNFVLSEVQITAISATMTKPTPIKIASATADYNQPGYEINASFDGNDGTGWAIYSAADPKWNTNRTAVFKLGARVPAGTEALVIRMKQMHPEHTLGKFRWSLGSVPKPTTQPTPAMRLAFLAEQQAEWEKSVLAKCVNWTVLNPVSFRRSHDGTIRKLDDKSLLMEGDGFYKDQYAIEFAPEQLQGMKHLTGVRLEALPDPSLPKGGPGRNPNGGYRLSEIELRQMDRAPRLVPATAPTTGPATLATTAPTTGPATLAATAPTTKATVAVATTAPATTQAAAVEDVAPGLERVELGGFKIALTDATATHAPENVAMAIDGKRDTHWIVGAGGDEQPRILVAEIKDKLLLDGKTRLGFMMLQNSFQTESIGRIRVSVTSDEHPKVSGLPADVEAAILVPVAQRSESQAATVRNYFLGVTPYLDEQRQEVLALKRSIPPFQTTMVMRERTTPRVTRLHHRGEYLQPADPVEPGLPEVLGAFPKGEKPNRLALAKWLVSQDNPLTARVLVNRTWAQYFGRGIVSTVDDFGTTGQLPSHPELLDWLATEFMHQGWSMKQLHRLIVTSATYQQSSVLSPELQQKDPANTLFARGPRVRVEAEIVRDIALTSAGLLSPKIGGPSVFPPQPAGVTQLSFGPMAWVPSTGEDRYRRGLYTFLKRTSPYPGLTTFDAPTSEVTCPVRPRSNTPLQALTTLNDEVYVEAARGMGQRVQKLDADLPGKVKYAFKLCVAREPTKEELAKITVFFAEQADRLKKDTKTATTLTSTTQPAADTHELAAWTLVSRALLNLDETITKE